ncbi:MAG: SPFH domain-containing protein [Akkermansiaceae bacterium]
MSEYNNTVNIDPNSVKNAKRLGALIIPIIILLFVFSVFTPFTTVPAGHVGVTSLFGKVDKTELTEGFHLINPLKKVNKIDCRNKQLTINGVGVPSQDQLTTDVDVTLKWRVDRTQAAEAFNETGDVAALETVHLTPKLRSLIREAGKGIKNAEDFYSDEIQVFMQTRILEGLADLSQKGILVEEVLLRRFDLPNMIVKGVEEKKRQKQAAERQVEELKRFTTEQEQKQVQAKAEKFAAVEEAEKRIALADAKAYEITAEAKAFAEAISIEGEALRRNPEILNLRAIQKWDGILPRVSLGEGATPLLNLSDLGKPRE